MDCITKSGGSTHGGRRWKRAGLTVCGALAAMAFLGGLGEAYVRSFPPRDCLTFLGEASPLRGPFVPDADFGVAYRSWQAFCDDNPRVQTFLPFESSTDVRPVWAFFGNSFAQAPGMLADTARARLPESRVFNLGRNEHLCVRLAQVRLLLENGLRPERIFIVLMPLDVAGLGLDSLASMLVTTQGALTYRPRPPKGSACLLVESSALARTAWFRTGGQHAHPEFRAAQLNKGVNPSLGDDLDHLFAALAHTAAEHQTPVTVLLIPNYEQITLGAPFGFQDAMTPLLRRQCIDVCDPRAAFLDRGDKPDLFIPDKHFSPLGNRILLTELLRHLEAARATVPTEVNPL